MYHWAMKLIETPTGEAPTIAWVDPLAEKHVALAGTVSEAEQYLADTLALGMEVGPYEDMVAHGLAYHAYCDALARCYRVTLTAAGVLR